MALAVLLFLSIRLKAFRSIGFQIARTIYHLTNKTIARKKTEEESGRRTEKTPSAPKSTESA
jgi:hypothetical protein